jgi:hypothetical protein
MNRASDRSQSPKKEDSQKQIESMRQEQSRQRELTRHREEEERRIRRQILEAAQRAAEQAAEIAWQKYLAKTRKNNDLAQEPPLHRKIRGGKKYSQRRKNKYLGYHTCAYYCCQIILVFQSALFICKKSFER